MTGDSAPDSSARTAKLDALMRAAERLTVELVTQTPYCALPEEKSLEDTIATAIAEGYDVLPIRNPDGSITRSVTTADLSRIHSWSDLGAISAPIGVPLLVAESSPLFALLGRFDETPILFVLRREGISGVVTVFDLNQPAAHQFAFGLALVVEGEIADVVATEAAKRSNGRSVDDTLVQILEQKPKVISKRRLDSWKRKKRRGEQLDVLESLGFAEKLRLLQRMRLVDEFARRAGAKRAGSSDRQVADLDEVRELRNDVAHERSGLLDHETTFRRMSLTYELAHRLVYGTPATL